MMPTPRIRPFWRYYGGKYRAAPRYPAPQHDTIIEPFAGAAGYSMRYYDRRVVLIEKYDRIAAVWRFLIAATPEDIRRIPLVENVDDLPASIPPEARDLVGFSLNNATTSPCKTLSAGRKKLAATGRKFEGWTDAQRESVAFGVTKIKHWKILQCSWDGVGTPSKPATYFVDPPYNNKAGSCYKHNDVDYDALATWCRSLRGQVIVCENEGATWLPFRPFAVLKAGISRNGNTTGSREVIWTNDSTNA